MRGKRGFTLIELLVVIAIIAILAAILFPVFTRAKKKAKQAACQSNLKQIALAFRMYTNDWDEKFPIWVLPCHGGPHAPYNPHWVFRVMPYVKNRSIFRCPDSHPGTWEGFNIFCTQAIPPGESRWREGEISYGYNEAIMGNFNGVANLPSIKYPAETALVFDCIYSFANPKSIRVRVVAAKHMWQAIWNGLLQCGCPPTITQPDKIDAWCRHPGGENIGFADGHVKFYSWQKLTSPKCIDSSMPIRWSCPDILDVPRGAVSGPWGP